MKIWIIVTLCALVIYVVGLMWYNANFVTKLRPVYWVYSNNSVDEFQSMSCSTGGYKKYLYRIYRTPLQLIHDVHRTKIRADHPIMRVVYEAKRRAVIPDGKTYSEMTIHDELLSYQIEFEDGSEVISTLQIAK